MRPVPTGVTAADPRSRGMTLWWVLAGLIAVMFGLLHWEFLVRSARASIGDPNWQHIPIAPLVAGYYIFLNRDRILARPAKLCWPGLLILFVGVFCYLLALYPGRNDMLRGFSMVVSLFGVVLFVQGVPRMKLLWFPVAFMVFTIKVSDSLWERIAFKLTLIAAAASEVVLEIFGQILGFTIMKDGQSLTMSWIENGQRIEHGFRIAEACSGLRGLMTFIFMGVAMAFLWDRFWWQRLAMILLSVPVALAVNIARVVTLGLVNLWEPELAKGDSHLAVGLLWYIPGLILFLGIGKVLDMMVIVDEDASARSASGQTDPPEALPTPTGAAVLQNSPWLLGGAVLSVLVGLAYVLVLNARAANPVLEWLGTGPSYVGAALCIVGVLVVLVVLTRFVRTVLAGAILLIGVMFTAAVGLQSTVAATEIALIKKPVEMRHNFFKLPRDIGSWTLIGEAEPLEKDVEDELGTDNYITRYYRDTRLPESDPAAVASVHLAYYTGMIDTVPHVPDRCWVAGGVEPVDARTIDLVLDVPDAESAAEGAGLVAPVQLADPVDGRQQVRLPGESVEVRTFAGTDPESRQFVSATYFFVANGSFYASPNQVRFLAFDMHDKYSYYCKVEVRFLKLTDPAEIEQRTTVFLSEVLPEIMACLPDWTDVRAGRWPNDGAPPPVAADLSGNPGVQP